MVDSRPPYFFNIAVLNRNVLVVLFVSFCFLRMMLLSEWLKLSHAGVLFIPYGENLPAPKEFRVT